MHQTPCEVRVLTDAAEFASIAGPWLLEREAEHNLLIGLTAQLVAGTSLFNKPNFHAVIMRDGSIVGCAFRTPPYKLLVTRMPLDCVDALVHSVRLAYPSIPAVMGDDATVAVFAAAWAAHLDTSTTPGMRHRIYQLDAVMPPARPPAGSARCVTTRDAEQAGEWIDAFSAEARIHTENSVSLALARIRQSSLYFWEVEGEPVSMAAWSGETPHGRRVGYVYTPPARRGNGYATALVAHLSQRILDDGCRFCFLYTDLSNPTSNSIYQQIGYRPVCDVMDWSFA